MRYYLAIICILLLWSCKEPTPRKPVSVKSGSFINESIERTKKLLAQQNSFIEQYIANDTTRNYLNSANGFWYSYTKKDSLETPSPVFGNKVTFKYDVLTLNDEVIYSTEELGEQSYHVDQENLMDGLRKGLKLMKKGEVVKFIFPSPIAYGYKGDRNKIQPNTPLICNIELINIELKQNNQK